MCVQKVLPSQVYVHKMQYQQQIVNMAVVACVVNLSISPRVMAKRPGDQLHKTSFLYAFKE